MRASVKGTPGSSPLHARTKTAAGLVGTILLAAALGAGCSRGQDAPTPEAFVTPAATDAGQATPAASLETTATAVAPAAADPLPSALSDLDQLLKSINGALSGSDAGGE
jgi:hypothetical protein